MRRFIILLALGIAGALAIQLAILVPLWLVCYVAALAALTSVGVDLIRTGLERRAAA